MGRASMSYREFRFIIEDELLQVYVYIEAGGDAPLGVQGWHHKTFPGSVTVEDALKEACGFGKGDKAVLWSLDAPES